GPAERRYQQVSGPGCGVLLGSAAGLAEGADTVRIINHDDDVLGECAVVLARQRHHLVERRMVAAHAEDAVSDDDRARAALGRRRKRALELAHVEMGIDVFLGWPSERNRVD